MDIDKQDLQQHAYAITMAVNSMVTAMGMQAENEKRRHEGKAPAYDEEAFQDVLNHNGTHHNAVLGGWR